MFLPPGKAMHLRAMCAVGTLRNYFCHCEERSDVAISRKGHNVEKQIKTDAGLRPSCAT